MSDPVMAPGLRPLHLHLRPPRRQRELGRQASWLSSVWVAALASQISASLERLSYSADLSGQVEDP